jgi:hypothetical protein
MLFTMQPAHLHMYRLQKCWCWQQIKLTVLLFIDNKIREALLLVGRTGSVAVGYAVFSNLEAILTAISALLVV